MGHIGLGRLRPVAIDVLTPRELALPAPLPDFYQVKAALDQQQAQAAASRPHTPKEAGYPIPFLSPAEQAQQHQAQQRLAARAKQSYQQLLNPLHFASWAQPLPRQKPKPKAGPQPGTAVTPLASGVDCFMPTNFWHTQYQKTPAGWKPRLLKKHTKTGVKYVLEEFNHWRDCCNTCKRLVKSSQGYVPETRLQVVAESGQHLVGQATKAAGLAQLDTYLAQHIPVMVGVHYIYGTTYNADHTTEHFVVLVGTGVEQGKKYYRFFDVGTLVPAKGTDPRNRLYQDARTGSYSGHSYATGHEYTLSQLRFK
ncbi:MAG: hypothetical protein EOO62_17580 [Hymenobacter sp.]|nr:MAG: hypothetical protein EOO62_17580 [Hymenobacter sp.]